MIQGNGGRQVTVDRIQLIEKLKANLVQHKADYEEAVIGYKIKLRADLENKLTHVKVASNEEVLEIKPVPFNPPRSYAKEYEDAITLLEWQVGDTVILDQTAFKQFVQNEWAWSSGFDVLNTTYKSFAASASLGG